MLRAGILIIIAITCAITLQAKSTRPTTNRTSRPAPKAGEILEMSPDQLGNFEHDRPNAPIPDDVKALDGVRIRLHGGMMPFVDEKTTTRFLLLAANESPFDTCCAETRPGDQPFKLQHVVLVTAPASSPVTVTPDEIVVEGTLHLGSLEVAEAQWNVLFKLEIDPKKPVVKWTPSTTRPSAADAGPTTRPAARQRFPFAGGIF